MESYDKWILRICACLQARFRGKGFNIPLKEVKEFAIDIMNLNIIERGNGDIQGLCKRLVNQLTEE